MKRRKEIRLKKYDYSENGWYSITICSIERKNIFGDIVGAGSRDLMQSRPLASARNNIQLSIIGEIIDEQWKDIPSRNNHIKLDQNIIMPNHIHGILIINKRADARPAPTISAVICSFKSKCTNKYIEYIKRNNLNISGKIWQRSFYDHIIRNEEYLQKIQEYIINNPLKWEDDQYYNASA